MGCLSLRFLAGIVGMLVVVIALSTKQATANDGGEFEGAVWSFKMTPRRKGSKTLTGRYRVHNHVLYQKDTRADPTFSKKVGRNYPNGKRTKIEFTDLGVFIGKKKVRKRIKGTALISLDKIGKWSGMFTDGRGRNWDYKCIRVQE